METPIRLEATRQRQPPMRIPPRSRAPPKRGSPERRPRARDRSERLRRPRRTAPLPRTRCARGGHPLIPPAPRRPRSSTGYRQGNRRVRVSMSSAKRWHRRLRWPESPRCRTRCASSRASRCIPRRCGRMIHDPGPGGDPGCIRRRGQRGTLRTVRRRQEPWTGRPELTTRASHPLRPDCPGASAWIAHLPHRCGLSASPASPSLHLIAAKKPGPRVRLRFGKDCRGSRLVKRPRGCLRHRSRP